MSIEKPELTPGMKQFFDVKKSYPDSILFFRMGDFYEMFDEDALIASKILAIALTTRNKNSSNPIPLCGIPYHSYMPYLVKLLKAGKKVAICEQLEDPKDAIGVVKRGVTRVVTPSTVLDEEALTFNENNFLLSVYVQADIIYVAAIDVSTGEVYLKKTNLTSINSLTSGFNVKEIISNSTLHIPGFEAEVRSFSKNFQKAEDKVFRHYSVSTKKSLFIDDDGFIFALSLAFNYLDDLLLSTKLNKPITLIDDDYLVIDNVATRTLELVASSDNSTKNTLFDTLNKTVTPMGARLLKSSILRPSRDVELIQAKLDVVEYFYNNSDILDTLVALLADIYDIERITGQIASGSIMPKRLVMLKNSLKNIPEVEKTIKSLGLSYLDKLELSSQEDLYNIIDKAIKDEPSNTIKDGDIIKDGFNNFIDEIRNVKQNANDLLSQVESKERENSGISQLKVGYNKVFGYFFEISKSNLSKVPKHFERKQTLVNAERFVTIELKELENKIIGADEKLNEIECKLFIEIRKIVIEYIDELKKVAKSLAELDILLAFAVVARQNRYVMPQLNLSGDFIIKDGRHPIVEQSLNDSYVANDYNLDLSKNNLLVVTGPNMAGKSTYLRAAALIAIMAHVGSFVPASFAEIGIVDRIFTRIGASDNLSKGESTFMVEMVETANILSNATKNSLIILDEIGRGTSTYDGVSIAHSVVEYILNKIGAKTLFATHYHELTSIADNYDGVVNYTVAVDEWQGDIIFLRKVIKGCADRSYGIHVGKLAGLPTEVTERADEILTELENLKPQKVKKTFPRLVQPILVFDDSHPVLKALQELDIDTKKTEDLKDILIELKKQANL